MPKFAPSPHGMPGYRRVLQGASAPHSALFDGLTAPQYLLHTLLNQFLRASAIMKINGNEIRPGNVIEHNNSLWVAVKTQAVKPGKGPAYNQVELKNLIDGSKLNERFRSSETVEKVRLEQKDFQFLYTQGDRLVFMDTDTYEQMELAQEFVGERSAFLQDGMKVVVELHEGRHRHQSTGSSDADHCGGRSGGERPDGCVVLQARCAGERRAHPGAALCDGRRESHR